MKQYDKVWIPTGISQGESVPADARTIGGSFFKAASGLICMSTEELRDMWNTAMERRDRDVYMRDIGKDDYNTAPTFEEYLIEQGINI